MGEIYNQLVQYKELEVFSFSNDKLGIASYVMTSEREKNSIIIPICMTRTPM